jgi:hypothetical protein
MCRRTLETKARSDGENATVVHRSEVGQSERTCPNLLSFASEMAEIAIFTLKS